MRSQATTLSLQSMVQNWVISDGGDEHIELAK
jgi:hypothetical protein